MNLLTLVGLGPGGPGGLTADARAALEEADLFCGYTGYIDLIRPLWPATPCLSTPMTRELERCRLALEEAAGGKQVAMVCSGDAGVYGMAGPVLELAPAYPTVEVRVVPGVSALLSGAAVLGAPLMNDFAVVSLSDLLTPWGAIEARLRAAAAGDFSLCLYNPSSKKRAGHLARACAILMETKSPDTPCGWVRQIGRPGQESWTGTLAQLAEQTVDMFTTVFVGSSATRLISGRLVTARGYRGQA